MVSPDDGQRTQALKILLCGGIAGVITWASVFPLGKLLLADSFQFPTDLLTAPDVVKTRVQTYDLQPRFATPSQTLPSLEQRPLLDSRAQSPGQTAQTQTHTPSALNIAREAYRTEGLAVFFRGLGVCSGRAFIVNAVQWAVRVPSLLHHHAPLLTLSQIYEWTMAILKPSRG